MKGDAKSKILINIVTGLVSNQRQVGQPLAGHHRYRVNKTKSSQRIRWLLFL